MRRAKIRPSINLSASRRSVTTPAPTDRNSAVLKLDLAASKSGQGSAAKPTPQSTPPFKKPDVTLAKQKQQSQQQQEKADGSSDTPQPTPPSQETPASPKNHTPSSPVKQPPSSPSKTTPDSPSKLANVRRKRFTAVPNLGQPRLRPTPSQPSKGTPKPQVAVVEKENDVGKNARGAGGGRGRKDVISDGGMGPQKPPPIQRVINSTTPASSSPSPAKEHTTPNPLPKQTPSPTQANKTSSQSNPTPSTPLRPTLARSDSISEKQQAGSDNIYEKKLRELKDRMDSETPAKRRHTYMKKKTQPPERSKMTMSDLIYFNPKTSPMKNTSGNKDKRYPRTIMTENVVSANNSVNNSAHNSDNDEEEQEEDADPFAPQVKIGPDGSIILDNKSLVKDAAQAKTLNLDSDVVQEESSNTTYASFRKRTYTTAWSGKDTAKFYMALSAVGTDFTMINAMFPKRTRQQIKNKFKTEERKNRPALDKAIRDRKQFDMSLFTNEPSSDSETENRITKRMKAKGKTKGGGTDKTKGKGSGSKKGRGKAKQEEEEDEDYDEVIASQLESIEENEARDEITNGETTKTTKDTATRQSEASDEEEVNMENILSQPTRSGRQPKFKTSFSAEEPPKKRRGAYRKTPKKKGPTADEDYAQKRMERLSQQRAETLAQKQDAKRAFPPYQPGRLLQPASQQPSDTFARYTSPGGVRQHNGSPVGSQVRVASPGSRGISMISTPMGRFIVSVPQHPQPKPHGVSPAPVGPVASSSVAATTSGATTKSSHIFVISSPDGTQNVIHIPVQMDTSSPGLEQTPNPTQPSNPTPPSNPSLPRQRGQNPMTTPGLVLKNLSSAQRPNQTAVIQQVSAPPRNHQDSSTTQQRQSHAVTGRCANPMSTPRILISSHQQRVQFVQSPNRPTIGRSRYPEPLTLPTGSNKILVMSPHATGQSQIIPLNVAVSHPHHTPEVVSATATSHDAGSTQCQTVETAQHSVSTAQVSEKRGVVIGSDNTRPSFSDERKNDVTPDLKQKVSHMTSDTDTDWLLRDTGVGHEVDIPTTGAEEAEVETEEAFIPSHSNLRNSPLHGSGHNQVIMGHVNDEQLSAQDILEQMTFEQGVGGDVGANMEIAINEEIITQIATEMTVE